jgi:chemotaxis protein CheZ
MVDAMSKSPVALSTQPASTPADVDYDTIYTAVMATRQGRWFLAEYARRNRGADTTRVIEAAAPIENVIRDGEAEEARRNVRVELIEMARTIAQTRADLAAIDPGPATTETCMQPRTGAIEAAERLQDMTWRMRERGFDFSICDQISSLTKTILAAAALRAPDGERLRRLGEALIFLEQRIDTMLRDNMSGKNTSNMAPPAAASAPSGIEPHDTPAPPAPCDPLAPLRAMSNEERIALFS